MAMYDDMQKAMCEWEKRIKLETKEPANSGNPPVAPLQDARLGARETFQALGGTRVLLALESLTFPESPFSNLEIGNLFRRSGHSPGAPLVASVL
jgi:hypothetical protein